MQQAYAVCSTVGSANVSVGVLITGVRRAMQQPNTHLAHNTALRLQPPARYLLPQLASYTTSNKYLLLPCMRHTTAVALKRHLSNKKGAADEAGTAAADAEPAATAARALRPKTPTPGEGVRACSSHCRLYGCLLV